MLSQVGGDGEEHPVAYFSRKLLPHEEKYSTVEKECPSYHPGYPDVSSVPPWPCFHYPDRPSIPGMVGSKENNSRLTRWSLALQPYQYSVQYQTGQRNRNAY